MCGTPGTRRAAQGGSRAIVPARAPLPARRCTPPTATQRRGPADRAAAGPAQDAGGGAPSGGRGLIQDINRHAQVVMEGTPADLPADFMDTALVLAAPPAVRAPVHSPCYT